MASIPTETCPICQKKYVIKNGRATLYEHMEKVHSKELNGISPAQYLFNIRNNKTTLHGNCIICKKPTTWNPVTEKYNRLCSLECQKKYRDMFKKRMLDRYGKVHLLDSPEQQKKMLKSRKISGTYTSPSGYNHTYTGTYEKNFLEFLDIFMKFDPVDVLSPAPQTFYYKDEEGKKRFYIPDFYIPSLNLFVEIKSFENKHYRERDKHLEELKADIVKKNKYNFVTIPDNKFMIFVDYLIELKKKNSKTDTE